MTTQDHQPVKVVAYGLIPFTRRGYLITQLVVFTVLMLLFYGAWLAFARWPYEIVGWVRWGVLLIAGLEGIETFVILRKFAVAERDAGIAADPG